MDQTNVKKAPVETAQVGKERETPQNRTETMAAEQTSTVIWTSTQRTARKAKVASDDAEVPLIDTTATLPLRSKKTDRVQKRLVRKQNQAASRPAVCSLMDLPSELLSLVLEQLLPSDLLRLTRVSRTMRSYIQTNESSLVRSVIQRNYHVLARTFPLPKPLDSVPAIAHPALLSLKRQEMLNIHKTPYSHVPPIAPHAICTCITCVLAWNNLALILDLAHWQTHLDSREPLPTIKRGTNPEWNDILLAKHAEIVRRAIVSPLTYAAILQRHLSTTVRTLSRTFKGKKNIQPKRLYHFTPQDAGTETDMFLERFGPPSFEFPWMRDCYYGLETYVPNRKWIRGEDRWGYYGEGLHERDVKWVVERFMPDEEREMGFVQKFWEECKT